MIDPVDFSLRGDRRQFIDCPAAATTYIEDREVAPYRDVIQTPVRELGVVRVHPPQHVSAQPSGWLAELTHRPAIAGHGVSDVFSLRFHVSIGR